MSDAFSIEFSSDNPWMKLYAFLLYRESCKGIWLNISPLDWYTYISSYGISVKVNRYWDSGGGQADGLHLDIHKYNDQVQDFSCYYYNNTPEIYMDHLTDVVRYMKCYMHGGDIKVDSFDNFKRIFDISSDMMSTALKTVSTCCSITSLFFTAKLMAVMYSATEEGESLDIVTKSHTTKKVEALKAYAFLAWLDMERTNYTGC